MFNFRMNERSLFAVLLRSPWWVSLLIGLMTSLLAHALLQSEFAWVVTMGALPFLAIAAIAAWRQWRAPAAAQLDAALERAAAQNWRDFSARMEAIYAGEGYVVTRIAGEAADFRLERQGQLVLLSCRRWKAVSHGVDALQRLQRACAQQDARGVFLSLVPVSDAARRYATDAGLQLLHGTDLARLLLR